MSLSPAPQADALAYALMIVEEPARSWLGTRKFPKDWRRPGGIRQPYKGVRILPASYTCEAVSARYAEPTVI